MTTFQHKQRRKFYNAQAYARRKAMDSDNNKLIARAARKVSESPKGWSIENWDSDSAAVRRIMGEEI